MLGRVKVTVGILSCGPTHLCSPTSYTHLCENPQTKCHGRQGEQEIARDCKLVIFRIGRKNLSQAIFDIQTRGKKTRICHQVLGDRIVRQILLFYFLKEKERN